MCCSFRRSPQVCSLQVDKISILFALLIFLYLGFCRPHRLAFAAPVLYAIMMATMMCYFWLAWTQHPL